MPVPKPLSQRKLDAILRKVKGKNAIEKMTHDDATYQYYVLSDKSRIRINKFTGTVEAPFWLPYYHVEPKSKVKDIIPVR